MTMLERLKELQAAATPGPWIVGGSYTVRTMRSSLDWIARMRDQHHSHADSEDAANAALIVTAINALPDLLAVVEAAEAVEASATAAYNARRMNVSRSKFDVLSAALAKLTEEEG